MAFNSTELYDSPVYYDDDYGEAVGNGSCEFDHVPDGPVDVGAFLASGVFLNAVGALGIAGNVVTMAVFSQSHMRSSATFLLSALAFCETVINAASVLMVGLPAIYVNTGRLYSLYFYAYPRYTPLVYPVWMTAQTLAVYLTLALTVERLAAVRQSLRIALLSTYKRAQVAFAVLFVSSAAYNAPRFWEIESRPFSSESDNSTIRCLFYTDLKKDEYYTTIYCFWCYTLLVFLVPFSAIAVLNSLIYKEVRKANSERRRLSLSRKKEIDIAAVLLCVVLAFFFCNVLAVVINYFQIHNTRYHALVIIDNLLVPSNSVINLIIYLTFIKKFRREFLSVLCIGFASKSDGEGSSRTNSSTAQIGLTLIKLDG